MAREQDSTRPGRSVSARRGTAPAARRDGCPNQGAPPGIYPPGLVNVTLMPSQGHGSELLAVAAAAAATTSHPSHDDPLPPEPASLSRPRIQTQPLPLIAPQSCHHQVRNTRRSSGSRAGRREHRAMWRAGRAAQRAARVQIAGGNEIDANPRDWLLLRACWRQFRGWGGQKIWASVVLALVDGPQALVWTNDVRQTGCHVLL